MMPHSVLLVASGSKFREKINLREAINLEKYLIRNYFKSLTRKLNRELQKRELSKIFGECLLTATHFSGL